MSEKETRAERIMKAVTEGTERFNPLNPDIAVARLQIPALSAATDVAANNVSMELGRLFRAGKLVRVGGRPVAYFSLSVLEKKLNRPFPSNQFRQIQEFLDYLGGTPPKETLIPPPMQDQRFHPGSVSELDTLIGADGSLASSIRQAKAAVIYPPSGLHTLITGPTGVGKSRFANCMFDFAQKSGALPLGASIVTFNCANYAENPQLVLSQLFGYMKGSFTGADRDHPGLVEFANGGILFLDEIHRLSPEGQEKMFLLMDHGVFQRLGETDNNRKASVLIIGATTEDPGHIMLSTFLRRIPVQIYLPELETRPLLERLYLALYFIWQEARNVKFRIYLTPDILSSFVHYRCPANVGQLATDIKLTCANAWYDYLIGKTPIVRIRLGHLSERVQEGLYTVSESGVSKLLRRLLRFPDQQLEISGGDSFEAVRERYVNDNLEV